MSADDEGSDVGIGLVAVRQDAEHVAAFFLFLLDDDVRGKREPFAVDAAHEIAVVELVLKFLEGLAGAGEEFVAEGVGDADGGDAAGGERGIKREGCELLDHFGIGAADDDQAACAFLPCYEGLVAQAGVAAEFIAAFLRDAFGHVAEDEHPFVLHIEVCVAAVGLDLFAVVTGGRLGCFDAVTGEDDGCGFDFAVLGEGEGFPVLVNGQGLVKEGQGVALAEGDAGGEVEVVEVGVVIAKGGEADFLENVCHILGGEFFTFGAGEATAEGITGKVGDLLLHVFGTDFGGGGGEVGFWSLGDSRIRIGLEAERGECVIVVPVGEINLRGSPCPAAAGPGEFFAIWREDGEAIETVRGGHAHGVVISCGIDDVEFEVGEALEVGGEDQVFAAGVEVGGPAHGTELGDGFLITAIGVHGPDLGDVTLRGEAAPADAFAIGAEEGAAIVAGGFGEALQVRAVGIGGVDLHEVLFVDFQAFLVLLAEFGLIGLAIAGEDDFLAIG